MTVRPANVVHMVTKRLCVELNLNLGLAKAAERHQVVGIREERGANGVKDSDEHEAETSLKQGQGQLSARDV